MITDAVILAAGKGSRLGDVPKPLAPIHGTPLIERVIDNLAAAGATRFVVVVGHEAARIRDALSHRPDVELVDNPDYERGNGISVIAGGRRAGGSFLLSMADHVYTPALARRVAACDLAAADLYLATDPRLDAIPDLADATKVRSDATGHIIAIGKTLAAFDRIDCGVFATTQRLVDELEALRAAHGDCSLSDGVGRLAERGRACIVDLGDELWLDVDTPADRERAERVFGTHE